MKIAISSDSALDIQQELIKKYDISVIPFSILVGDKEEKDSDIDILKMFEYCDKNKTLPKTSAVNSEQFKEYFSQLLKENDAVIHFDISSQMSTTLNQAKAAAAELENVYVIDSKNLSTGIALLVIYARELTKTIDDPKKIVSMVESRVPYVQASFVIDRLDYLKMGGRCSAMTAFSAKILNIHPMILVKNGKMGVHKKYLGRKMNIIVSKYCHDVLAEFNHPDKSVIFVTHSHADQDMVDAAKEAIKDLGFENVYETTANATVSSHCGKNTLGILYINDAKESL